MRLALTETQKIIVYAWLLLRTEHRHQRKTFVIYSLHINPIYEITKFRDPNLCSISSNTLMEIVLEEGVTCPVFVCI